MNRHIRTIEEWPWDDAVLIQPSRFDATLSVHDSALIDPIIMDTSLRKVILIFDWDIHWNRNLIPPEFDDGESYLLAIAINDVVGTDSSGSFAAMSDGAKPTNIVMGMSSVEAQGGYRTTLEILERSDFGIDHLGGIEVLCTTSSGTHVPLRLRASA